MTITALILTRNEERHITACIESVNWADQILVLDSYSDDATVAVARRAGAIVKEHPFENYSKQRNAALAAVAEDPLAEWVLFLDADERATPALGEETSGVTERGTKAGWWIPRHNYIFGHRMRGAGWWPDYQLRLLKRGRAHYAPERAVHEEAILEGEAGYLREPLIHYNYETLAQFKAKQRRYVDYDAGILLQKGVHPHLYTPYTQIPRHFWWRFITLEGWKDGLYGLLLAGWMAYYEMVKYRKVRRGLRDDR
ncbi:MAG: glycosyltransferase family 2 protein [Anaerolineales bacterium]